MSAYAGILKEGSHTFACWGAGMKYSKYHFLVAHRLHEHPSFKKDLDKLKRLAHKAALACEECKRRKGLMKSRNKGKKLVIDENNHQVLADGKPIQVTNIEYKLLLALRNKKGAISKEELLKAVWGIEAEYDVVTQTLTQHIARLRKKFGKDCVVTINRFGFRLGA